ncbi:MAG: DUF4258 domain-containing protein [Oscillospiraceae bacterium]|nr:DUF4258 domain-containing protein [Oscillospiraceae bacterium]
MLDIENIKHLCKMSALRWTDHIVKRLLKRNISTADVECAIMNSEIIELYPDDYPYPSCLILGLTADDRYLHIVCGVSPTELYLVTAYHPNPDEWSEDFKIRKEQT